MRRPQIKLHKKWSDYINKHPNSKWLVCGIGPSLRTIDLEKYKDHHIIGVNDIEKYIKPDYIVIVDRLNTFPFKRKMAILNSKCKEIFVNNPQFSREIARIVFDPSVLIEISLKNINKDPYLESGKIVFSNNSTFVACDIARRMGGTDIKIIGVDFTGHKSLDNDKALTRINNDYAILNKEFKKRGIKLTNISKISKLKIL